MSSQQQLGLYDTLVIEKPAARCVQRFDGQTFDPGRDTKRLSAQLDRVRAWMLARYPLWATLDQIEQAIGRGSAAGISARLRDLRKPRFGSYTVERRYMADGLWEYRVLAPQRSTRL